MNKYPEEEETSSGPGLGTLGALLAAGALSLPVARPVRNLIGRGYEKFGSPLANTGQALATDLAPISDIAKKGINAMTGGATNLAGRSYVSRKAAGGFGNPNVIVGEEVVPKINPNWEDTMLGAKALGGAVADFIRATPAATRVARGATKRAGERAQSIDTMLTFNPQTDLQKAKQVGWSQFNATDPRKKFNLNNEDLDMIGKIFSQAEVKTPMEATLQYLRMLKQAESI